MIITIAGEAGSGKGTISKILKEKMNYEYFSMGDIRREIAKTKNITIDELNKIGEKEKWTDSEVDNFQREILSKKDNIIVDGRLSWHFIKNSLKIFLYVDENESAKRIFNNQRDSEKKFNKIKEVIEYNKERKNSDIKRYKKYYKINPYEKNNFDLTINTTNKTPKEIVEEIMKKIK